MDLPLRSRLPVLLLLLLLPLLAACGGTSSKQEYEEGLGRIQAHLQEAGEASRESGDTTDVEERREKLGEAHAALADAARVARELEPPKDAQPAHRRFARALQEYADLFDRLARLDANDPSETELYSEAGEITKRLDRASRDLAKAGYEVDEERE